MSIKGAVFAEVCVEFLKMCHIALTVSPLPAQKSAPTDGSRTELESPPDSPGWRYETLTSGKESIKDENNKLKRP